MWSQVSCLNRISFHEYTDPRDGLLPKDALRPEGPKTYIAYGL
jgi:hypothetical protein